MKSALRLRCCGSSWSSRHVCSIIFLTSQKSCHLPIEAYTLKGHSLLTQRTSYVLGLLLTTLNYLCKERVDQRFIASFILSLLPYTEPMHTSFCLYSQGTASPSFTLNFEKSYSDQLCGTL